MPKQLNTDAELLAAVAVLQDFHCAPPSYGEVGRLLGRWVSGLVPRFRRLEEEGLIDLGPAGQPRRLRLTPEGRRLALGDTSEVPLIPGRRPPWETRRAA